MTRATCLEKINLHMKYKFVYYLYNKEKLFGLFLWQMETKLIYYSDY